MGKKKKEVKEKPLEKMTAKELREVGKQMNCGRWASKYLKLKVFLA